MAKTCPRAACTRWREGVDCRRLDPPRRIPGRIRCFRGLDGGRRHASPALKKRGE
ncbi:hypothetical protein [Lysobacter gummosus]|uniref:hypothetical protein n=1 Tax=Lysobacter gummosus TaxID=262324 RepID=UPI00363C6003